jgi:hypothetical protein
MDAELMEVLAKFHGRNGTKSGTGAQRQVHDMLRAAAHLVHGGRRRR